MDKEIIYDWTLHAYMHTDILLNKQAYLLILVIFSHENYLDCIIFVTVI